MIFLLLITLRGYDIFWHKDGILLVGMEAVLGKVDVFDTQHEEWPQYVERLDQFFEANDLTGDAKATKRRATFLTVIGPGPYKLLRSLISPAKPTDKTYDELVQKLTEHYSPTPSEVMQRFRFNSRSRKEGESVAAYLAELRRLAEHCNYGDTLDKMLRDRLVWGINDAGIQRKLLQENDPLTLARTLTIAKGAETADKNLKEMKAPVQELDSTSSSPASVKVKSEPVQKIHAKKKLSSTKGAQGGVTCHRCGNPGHLATACRFKDKVCRKCKKRGHLARVCRSMPPPSSQGSQSRRPTSQPVRQVDEESEDDSDDSMQHVYTLEQERDARLPPIKVHMELDHCSVPMEVDTGASVSIMPETLYHKLWPRRGLKETTIRLQTYSKEPIPVVGATQVHVAYEGQTATLPLVVVKGKGPTLLGRNWLSKIRLNWSQIHYTTCPGLHDLLAKYSGVFQEGLGSFKEYEAKINVDPDASPQFYKARTVPYAMREKVEAELDRLVAEGTLEPVEYSDWAAPIVPVVKSDRKSVRICGDFKVTVNPVSKLHRYPIPKIEDIFARLEGGKIFTKLDLSAIKAGC